MKTAVSALNKVSSYKGLIEFEPKAFLFFAEIINHVQTILEDFDWKE